MNLNKAIVVGRLTRDPELRSTSAGQNVTNFSIATNRFWTNAQGERQELVEYHNIVAWGKLAEIASQYLSKGRLAMIEGRLQTRSWEGQDGGKRTRTEIVAENLQLGPRAGESGAAQNKSEDLPTIQQDQEASPAEPDSENIPF